MRNTKQENFWESDFGKVYSDRNLWQTDTEWDEVYKRYWGYTKLEINDSVLNTLPKDSKILEVGCNIGMQLRGLQRMGFENLYGIELQNYAVEKAKKVTENINIIQGSGFDIPFRDSYFDLVCTNGVLIHIAPSDHKRFLSEIHRCTNKLIMGWEYYAPEITEINYRGNTGYLWKADFAGIYKSFFKDLEIIKRKKFPYIFGNYIGNTDEIFLLAKYKIV